jgi:hypothetical protein
MIMVNNKEIKMAACAWSLEKMEKRIVVLHQPVVVT